MKNSEKNNNAREMLDRYLEGNATPQERAIIESWYLDYTKNIADSDVQADFAEEDTEALGKVLYRYISHSSAAKPIVGFKIWRTIYRVAASLIFIAAGAWLVNSYIDKSHHSIVANDVYPANQGAILTLADGRKIKVNASSIGSLAKENGIKIVKSADGELTYILEETVSGASAKMNTLSTSKGETFHIRLPDGSMVWLNAASSVTFPVSFASAVYRKVELKGEAYFDVASDKTKPFIVISNNQTVEVLGTRFNIASYDDEKVEKTALIEGSVKLNHRRSPNKEHILIPGQQAIIEDDSVRVAKVDIDEVSAWRKGVFMFNDEALESILLKISRWYDVDISYQDESLKKKSFWGIVTKHDKLSKVLEMLEKTNTVKFEVRGNKIVVKKVNKP